jgi:6-phosphogluconolactonase
MLPHDTRVLADAEAVACEAASLIAAAAVEAIRRHQVFRLVLAGGSTPRRAYQLLAETAQDWAAWEIFWGDERCLPADHPDRNSRMAHDAWLAHVAIPEQQIHEIPAELGAEAAAAAYAETLRDRLPFDLVLLGMGEDGHTASLFPGRASESATLAIAVDNAPKAPAARVSLSAAALGRCMAQLVLVTGSGKVAALAAWRAGADLPIARAVRCDATLLLDEAVARGTRKDVDVQT